MKDDGGGISSASTKGLVSTIFGGLYDSLKLPLHEAGRRERDDMEALPLPFIALPPLAILSMLGNLCMFIFEEDEGDWKEPSTDVEGSSANPVLS